MNIGERMAHADHEVEACLTPEQIPAWRKMRRQIRATEYASRLEVFEHWMHENPGEVSRWYEAEIERSVAALVRIGPPEPTAEPVRAPRSPAKAPGRRSRRAPAAELPDATSWNAYH